MIWFQRGRYRHGDLPKGLLVGSAVGACVTTTLLGRTRASTSTGARPSENSTSGSRARVHNPQCRLHSPVCSALEPSDSPMVSIPSSAPSQDHCPVHCAPVPSDLIRPEPSTRRRSVRRTSQNRGRLGVRDAWHGSRYWTRGSGASLHGESGRSDAGRRSHGSPVETSSILVSSRLETCDRRSYDHPRAPREAAAADRSAVAFGQRSHRRAWPLRTHARPASSRQRRPHDQRQPADRMKAPRPRRCDGRVRGTHPQSGNGAGAPACGPASATAPRDLQARDAHSDRICSATRCPSGEPGWRRRPATDLSSTSTASHVWFDLFQPIRFVSVFFAGGLNPGAARADLGDDHRPAVVSHRSGQRLDRLEPDRTGGGAAGLLHGPEDQGRLARSVSGRHRVGRQHHHPGSATASLHLDLDQAAAPHCPQDAGIDAAEAIVQLPEALRPAVSASGQQRRRRGRIVHGVWLPGGFQAVGSDADLAAAHRPDPRSVLRDHAHERAGSLRDRLVEVGALHGRRPRADRSSADGLAAAGREDRSAHGWRRRRHRLRSA